MEAGALNVESSRFTPVRRRQSTINNRTQQGDSEKEWTAARCNRLLRALTSRVAILKKDISRLQSATGSKITAAESNAGNRKKRGCASPGDADWAHSRKKIKKTYSARGGRSSSESRTASFGMPRSLKDGLHLIPGEISMPTPTLHRALWEHNTSQYSAPIPTDETIPGSKDQGKRRPRPRDREVQFQLSKTMRELRKITPTGRYTTYEGIYYGLEGLLRVTTPTEEEINLPGTGSFLSMCLRAIPHYIKKEEALLTDELEKSGRISAINRRDVSTEIYDDLETFGSSGHGWKHLRTVVRAHGIQVLCMAIQEGLIDLEVCGILVSLCVNMHATREAEILLSALLSTGNFTKPKSVVTRFDDDIATRPLSMFWDFAARRGCFSYQYRRLSSMFANGNLHTSWLATREFITFWARAVQEFSSESVDPNAITFFHTALPLLATYGNPGQKNKRASDAADVVLLEPTKQTFSSLVVTLSIIVILSKGADHPEGSVIFHPNYNEVTRLFRTCLAQWTLDDTFNMKYISLVLAILMIESYDGGSPDVNLVDLVENYLPHINSAQLSTTRNELATFVCSIARCCGRGVSNSGFEYLRRLHISLETFAYNRELDGVKLVQEIIVDSAFAFAQQVPNRQHLDYATSKEAELRVMRRGSVDSTSSENVNGRAGYRWEDGISEWVVATPVARSVKSFSLEESSVDDSECETPFHHRSHRTRPIYPVCSTLTDLAPSSVSKHDYSDTSRSNTPGYESSGSDGYSDGDDTATTSHESMTESDVHKSYQSDDELFMGSVHDEDLEMDELCRPGSPSLASDTSTVFGKSRYYVGRAPRLSRKVLRQRLHWEMFDESDDELSFLSALSHNSPSQGSTDGRRASAKSQVLNGGKRIPRRVRSTARLDTSLLGDSEDELGM